LKIVGVETSSTIFSLAVHEDDQLLYEIRRNRHAYTDSRDAGLFAAAQDLVRVYKPDQIKALVISIGPGMFTSLRVGLSLVKGLALAHRIPTVAVNTLDVIGIPLSYSEVPVIAVIDAFHDEIYAAQYEYGKLTGDYELTTPYRVLERGKGKRIIAGPGVESFRKSGKGFDDKDLIFLAEDFVLPSATKLIRIALPRIMAKKYEDIEVLEPFYIKKTDAERNYHKTNAV
jgi:tRNA threonylcarbamoyladenosine biosynthesis protein TsaB